MHTNVKHSLRQLEEIVNIEKNVTAGKNTDFSWMRWLIVAFMIIGVFALALAVIHK